MCYPYSRLSDTDAHHLALAKVTLPIKEIDAILQFYLSTPMHLRVAAHWHGVPELPLRIMMVDHEL